MDKSNIEYLENCLAHTLKQLCNIHGKLLNELDKLWYANNDTVLSVARILDEEFCFRDTSCVIDFFEKPYKWEYEMKNIVEENKEGDKENG